MLFYPQPIRLTILMATNLGDLQTQVEIKRQSGWKPVTDTHWLKTVSGRVCAVTLANTVPDSQLSIPS